MTGDDVIGAAKDVLALVGSLSLAHGHKDIGAAAEVYQSVFVVQVGAQQVCHRLQVDWLSEVPPIAAIPAPREDPAVSSIQSCWTRACTH